MISDTPVKRQDSYDQFFGFRAPPFSLSAKPRFRFPSVAHEDALSQVMYALERREPVIVVTGDIGLGKTLLCRALIERLPRKTFLSVIDDPLLGRDDLLKRMLEDFGIISAEHAGAVHASRHDLARTMNTFLSSLAPLEAHAVVIVDEAQHLQPDAVEQIRLLANTSDDHGTLLQIVLVGQPSLQELLARPELQQLRQRVTRCVSLTALIDAEVKQYIAHRIAVAREPETNSPVPGADDLAREVGRWNASRQPVTFTDEAIQAVTRISHGIPRLVNVLCDRALEGAFAERSPAVDAFTVETAALLLHLEDAPGEIARGGPHGLAGEATADESVESHASPRTTRYAAAAAALFLATAGGWFGLRALHRDPGAQRRSIDAPATRQTSSDVVLGASAAPVPAQSEAIVGAAAATANPSPPNVAAKTTDAFEIVVASFRTEARARDVVAELTGLGQPARTRLVDGWQQVLAGPFASATDAEDAQRQLDREGFGGTRVEKVAR